MGFIEFNLCFSLQAENKERKKETRSKQTKLPQLLTSQEFDHVACHIWYGLVSQAFSEFVSRQNVTG
jgi:hypothetical protein